MLFRSHVEVSPIPVWENPRLKLKKRVCRGRDRQARSSDFGGAQDRQRRNKSRSSLLRSAVHRLANMASDRFWLVPLQVLIVLGLFSAASTQPGKLYASHNCEIQTWVHFFLCLFLFIQNRMKVGRSKGEYERLTTDRDARLWEWKAVCREGTRAAFYAFAINREAWLDEEPSCVTSPVECDHPLVLRNSSAFPPYQNVLSSFSTTRSLSFFRFFDSVSWREKKTPKHVSRMLRNTFKKIDAKNVGEVTVIGRFFWGLYYLTTFDAPSFEF